MQALRSPRGGTVFRLLGSGTIRVGDEVVAD
jgi:MOSC domain-containing protein YiiM